MRTVFLIFLAAILCEAGKNTTNTKQKGQWRCKDSSTLIPLHEVCNGQPDCPDKSDESLKTCLGVRCPPNLFRCGYGGCVRKIFQCDGKDDCMDGTDEAYSICHNRKSVRANTTSSLCSDGMAQCEDGKNCIDIRGFCNGKEECPDGSDETGHECYHSPSRCGTQAFECSYGACISGDLHCDNKHHCKDGSDEILCDKTGSEKSTCVVEMSVGTLYERDGGTNQWTKIKEETRIRNLERVKMSCETSFNKPKTYGAYVFDGNYMCVYNNESQEALWFTMGERSKKIEELPRCYKKCRLPSLLGDSLTGSCENKVDEQGALIDSVPCDEADYGTTMKLHCKENYVTPPELTNFKTEGVCQANGEWDVGRFKCVPECGRPMVDNPVGREQAVVEGEYPWHAVLYRHEGSRNIRYCSGSIIGPNLIMTAAHCVEEAWNESDGTLDNIRVGVGKTTIGPDGEFSSGEMLEVLPPGGKPFPNEYTGETSLYSADIAVLELKQNIRLNNFTRPICLDWKRTPIPFGETPAALVSYGPNGLKVSPLRYAPCDGALQVDVPADKFCAIFNNEKGASELIDRNGGSAFILKGQRNYFLFGILSKQADPDFRYATFTNVSSRIRWLQQKYPYIYKY